MNNYDWNKRFEIVENFPVDQNHLVEVLANVGLDIKVVKSRFYNVAGMGKIPSLSIFKDLMWDQALQKSYTEAYNPKTNFIGALSVSFLPGVTDNSGKALEEAFRLKNLEVNCFSGDLYLFYSSEPVASLSKVFDTIKNEVGNSLIQEVKLLEREDFLKGERFNEITLPLVNILHEEVAYEISLDLNDEDLLKLSSDRCLALNLEEMRAIKSYYEDKTVIESRSNIGLGIWPTDVELEVLAQTWSEHCKHKIFAANISYKNTETGETEEIKSLYKSYIQRATKELDHEGIDWLVSVFSDNAGIVRFDENIDLCIKVETHNSPSALDPYGGAITGILGVNRDILGCGLGAKPIANTDVFCFASTELPNKIDPLKLPAGLMEPARLLRGVHKGVEDGGNKSGIPTVNGAIVFDIDYAGKPLVFCGTIGTLPAFLKDGRPGSDKGAKKGDHIFVVGGAVGADGIHGATFSSMELNEDSPATAVQIGDPLTQKRVMDFLLEARDQGLYTCVTDNGAGGISSSIGEMAEFTGGATIDLDLHPRKYPGLSPWEIMISESQERMTFAVDPKNSSSFKDLAVKRGVSASKLGTFKDDGILSVNFKGKLVAALPMDFLHDGVPTLELNATSETQPNRTSWIEVPKEKELCSQIEILKTLLHSENIASKEPWVRQYDHEVQGATIGKPFPGVRGVSPGDSGVIDLEAHGGSAGSMVSVGCGMAPRWSARNANLMAKLSVDEAVRNIIVSGVEPDKICLLDNFCWPDPVQTEKNPYGDIKLGQLVDSCKGLYEICKSYKTPLVSGKDSMKNDFRGKNRGDEPLVISIQPTLLVTAMGYGEQKNLLRSVVNKEDVVLYRFGVPQLSFFGSEIVEHFNASLFNDLENFSDWDFSLCSKHYQGLYLANKMGLVESAHDVSDGGLLTAISEMLFDNRLGFKANNIPTNNLELFGEGPGMIVVGVSKSNQSEFEEFCSQQDLSLLNLGETTVDGECYFFNGDSIQISELETQWRRDWGI